MADVAVSWAGFGADLALAGGDLLADDGLQTAVVLSLFTDGLAGEGDTLPDLQGGRRGWWGDALPPVKGDRIGSRLWLLSREKQLPQVLRRAEEYAREALQWLVDDGVARAVEVSAEAPSQGLLALQVSVVRSAQPVARYRFDAFWKGA